ncbi:hypothetical protein MVEN_00880900 [Mycena venus]|uniref:Uncharacterized protein n=1 Tax=Mycena venus TaxID=2733690 RepID=A0A8H7D1R5_9AGAR|nr:hypothetical protein MVEN_00880900 [Mycena venus]
MAAGIVQLFALVVALHFAAASPTPQFVTVADPFASVPVPIYASVAGVDLQGHTTYVYGLFDSVATDYNVVVAGAGYYSVTENLVSAGQTFAIGGECGLQGSVAACTVEYPTSTTVFTESGLGVIVFNTGPFSGATATAPPTGRPGSSAPTNAPNSGHRMSSPVLAFVLISLSLGYYLF